MSLLKGGYLGGGPQIPDNPLFMAYQTGGSSLYPLKTLRDNVSKKAIYGHQRISLLAVGYSDIELLKDDLVAGPTSKYMPRLLEIEAKARNEPVKAYDARAYAANILQNSSWKSGIPLIEEEGRSSITQFL